MCSAMVRAKTENAAQGGSQMILARLPYLSWASAAASTVWQNWSSLLHWPQTLPWLLNIYRTAVIFDRSCLRWRDLESVYEMDATIRVIFSSLLKFTANMTLSLWSWAKTTFLPMLTPSTYAFYLFLWKDAWGSSWDSAFKRISAGLVFFSSPIFRYLHKVL